MYYLTKNRSTRQTQRQTASVPSQDGGIHADFDAIQPSRFVQKYGVPTERELLDQHKSSFKKRHVSQIQDRIHSNTMKNMQLIQKQIQVNTKITKNRLAGNKGLYERASAGALPETAVRSKSVNATARKKGVGPKTFYQQRTSREEQTSSMAQVNTATTGANMSNENLQNQTWTSVFDPLIPQQPGPYESRDGVARKKSDQRSSNMIASNTASQFGGRRTKVASQYTYSSLQELGQPESNAAAGDASSLSKELRSLKRANPERRTQSQLEGGPGTAVLGAYQFSEAGIGPRSPIYSGSYEQAIDRNISASEMKGAQGVSRAQLGGSQQQAFMATTELDGKRLANNLAEAQLSRLSDDSRQILNTSTQLNDVSVMLSQTAYLGGGPKGKIGECPRCKTWKRINQECRNLSQRTDFKDVESVFRFLAQMGTIDSVQRVTPELSRALCQLAETLKRQYESSMADLTNQVFKLKKKLEDTQNLADKYKVDLQATKKAHDEIYNFIHGEGSIASVKHGAEYQAFVEDEGVKNEEIEAARKKHTGLEYSWLTADLQVLNDDVKLQTDFVENTVKMLEDKVHQNKLQSQFQTHIPEMYDREDNLQQKAVREFMQSHFRNGLDPPTLTLDKGCVTSVNMVSEKRTRPNRADLFAIEQEQRQKETMTQIKFQNSLLCQLNQELKQEVADSHAYEDEMDAKFAQYKDLDINVVKQQKDKITLLERENDNTKRQLAKTEEIRGNLNSDKLGLVVQVDQYEQEVKVGISNRNEILKLIKEIRSEITHPDMKPENDGLDQKTSNFVGKKFNSKIKPPGPGQPSGVNMFKRDVDEQRKCIIESLQQIQKVIARAYAENQPLLATKQMIDTVFAKYKNQAQAQEKAKYDQLLDENKNEEEERRKADQEAAEQALADAQAAAQARIDAANKKAAKMEADAVALNKKQAAQEKEAAKIAKQKPAATRNEAKQVQSSKQSKKAKRDKDGAKSVVIQEVDSPESNGSIASARSKAGRMPKASPRAISPRQHKPGRAGGKKTISSNKQNSPPSAKKNTLQFPGQVKKHASVVVSSPRSKQLPKESVLSKSPKASLHSEANSVNRSASKDQQPSFKKSSEEIIFAVMEQDPDTQPKRSAVSLANYKHQSGTFEIAQDNPTNASILESEQVASPPGSSPTTGFQGVAVLRDIAAVAKIGEQPFAPDLRDSRSNSLEDSIQGPMEIEPAKVALQIKISSQNQSLASSRQSQDLILRGLYKTSAPEEDQIQDFMNSNERMSDIQRRKVQRPNMTQQHISRKANASQDSLQVVGNQYVSRETVSRIQELQLLMTQFQKNPEDPVAKNNYFSALKSEYGQLDEPTSNPYLPTSQHYSLLEFRNHSQSPNNKYSPNNRMLSPQMKNVSARQVTPPKNYVDSKQPKDYARIMNSATSLDSDVENPGQKSGKANSPGKEFFRSSLGVETRAKRIDRRLKENSRAIQCDLLTDQKTKYVSQEDKNVQVNLMNKSQQQPYQDKGMINMPERILNIANTQKLTTEGFSAKTTPSNYKDKVLNSNKTIISELKKQQILQSTTEQKQGTEIVWRGVSDRNLKPSKAPMKQIKAPIRLNKHKITPEQNPTPMQITKMKPQMDQNLLAQDLEFSQSQIDALYQIETLTEGVQMIQPPNADLLTFRKESVMMQINSLDKPLSQENPPSSQFSSSQPLSLERLQSQIVQKQDSQKQDSLAAAGLQVTKLKGKK